MIFLVILAFVVLVVIWYIATHNRLIRLQAMMAEAWSGIDVQLKRRYDLIPNLVETVKGYARHEEKIFTDLAQMRSRSMGAVGVKEKAAAENALVEGLRTLFAVAEAYPDLKANQNFLQLQKDLAEIEDQLQLARRYYNGTARNFNVAVQSIPSSLVAGGMGLKPAEYFEVESAAVRETPKVSF